MQTKHPYADLDVLVIANPVSGRPEPVLASLVPFAGTEIRVDAPEPYDVIIDGEAFATTPLTSRVLPRGLNVIVPAADSSAA